MKNYIVYLENGEILKTGYCSNDDISKQGENVIEGVADDSCQYIQDGQVVDMPPKPEENSYFDYESKQWVLNYSAQEQEIKFQRNELLYKSDWTQISNNPLTQEQQDEWAAYRQELRDVTSQSGYPFNVIWPTPPQG